MRKEDFRIVYLGTPDFAVESLRRLVEGGYNVVAVVTMPDKPIGRHQNHLQPSPVKQYALEHGLPLMQPANLKDSAFLEQLKMFRADLQIVVAFRMLPQAVWAMPRLGTFNLHASLLPQYRGAAPINWAIMNGEKETGITTFLLEKDIDTGEIIDQISVPISPDETFGELHNHLMQLGGNLVLKTVDSMIEGTFSSHPQQVADEASLKPAPKIFRDTCRIDWSKGLDAAYNQIRGLSPVPAAWTMLQSPKGEEQLKIYKARKIVETHAYPVGSVLVDGIKSFYIALPEGFLDVKELQIAGKKRMLTEDFLRGFKCPEFLKVSD